MAPRVVVVCAPAAAAASGAPGGNGGAGGWLVGALEEGDGGDCACVVTGALRVDGECAELAALLPAGIGIVGTYGSPPAAELAPPGATLAVAAEREDVADGGDVHVHWRVHGADAVADVRDVHAVNSLLARERVVLRARAELLLRPSSSRRGGEGEGEEDAVERAEAEAVDAVNTLLAPPLAFAFPEGAGEGEGAAPVLVDVGAGAHDGAEGPICEDVCGRGTAALMQRRVASAGNLQLPAAPVLHLPAAAGASSSAAAFMPVRLDALAYAPRALPLARACGELLCGALRAQARAAARAAASSAAHGAPPAARHYMPPAHWPHALTLLQCVPPTAADAARAEDALARERAAYHALLCLPLDRPLLREGNALRAVGGGGEAAEGGDEGAGEGAARLVDPHATLSGSGVRGGAVHMVRGSYEYCHYLQDRFDDKGWGCAYRSLQTIASWFRRAHYTSAAPPDHAAIQRALVDVGDKPRSFVGSRQWVGAIELSYVLDRLYGVSCRVLTVPQGQDMWTDTKWARDLCRHFDTEGTPVMVGGGVLAYTMVGVDFNEETGDVAYLILDPHYTGADEVKPVHAGGWVGWKRGLDAKGGTGGLVFDKASFYNLLLPLRPKTV